MITRFSATLIVAASVANAECPPQPNIQAEQDRILAEVRVAPNEMAARQLSNGLWELWAKAPDDHAQELLDQGMGARAVANYERALEFLNELVVYCPGYAEGYNQRAFVNFLSGDFEMALADLDLALERRPTHVAALAGKAMTLIGLGRDQDAQIVLREALALNPWLSERRFLIEPDAKDL